MLIYVCKNNVNVVYSGHALSFEIASLQACMPLKQRKQIKYLNDHNMFVIKVKGKLRAIFNLTTDQPLPWELKQAHVDFSLATFITPLMNLKLFHIIFQSLTGRTWLHLESFLAAIIILKGCLELEAKKL